MTNLNIESILENAFQIKRKGTKQQGLFVYNTFERPITHLTLFQLLADSNINLTSHELTHCMCHIHASDYIRNWNSDAILVVSKNHIYIKFRNAEHLNLNLNVVKFKQMFHWFSDDSVFSTDFGNIKHSEKYYLSK